MTRLLVSVAAFGLLVGSSLRASVDEMGFVESLNTMPEIEGSSLDGACANFTGSWKGVCTNGEGKKKEEAFTVKQKGCEALEISADKHKMVIPVGGVFSLGGSIPGTPAVTFGGNITSHWDADHKVLSLHVMGGGKKLTIDSHGKGFFLSENVQLTDGKLAVKMFVMADKKKHVATCLFDKQ